MSDDVYEGAIGIDLGPCLDDPFSVIRITDALYRYYLLLCS